MKKTKQIESTFFDKVEEAYQYGAATSCGWADARVKEIKDIFLSGYTLEIVENGRILDINSIEELTEWKSKWHYPNINFGTDNSKENLPKLRFMLDYGCSPLWSGDEITESKFGHNIIELSSLGINERTLMQINKITELYEFRLNPIYQGYPSFWSGKMQNLFKEKVKTLWDNIISEIGFKYQIENKEKTLFSQIINEKEIDTKLSEFLENPVAFSETNRINFSSEEELKNEINKSYIEWRELELKLLAE